MIYFRQIISHPHPPHHHRRLQPHCHFRYRYRWPFRKLKLQIELLLCQLERLLPFQLHQLLVGRLVLCDQFCPIYLDWLTKFWFDYPQDVFVPEWCRGCPCKICQNVLPIWPHVLGKLGTKFCRRL